MTVEAGPITPSLQLPQEVSEIDRKLTSLSRAIRRVIESDPHKTEYEANAVAVIPAEKTPRRIKELATLCLPDPSKLAAVMIGFEAQSSVPIDLRVGFLSKPGAGFDEGSISGIQFYVRGLEVDPEVEDGLPYYEAVDLFDEAGEEMSVAETERSVQVQGCLIDEKYYNFQLGLLEEIVASLVAQNAVQPTAAQPTQ